MPNPHPTFLRKQTHWEDLYFYQKANTLYMLTFRFTERFLRKGDRTIDQMVQAARSGKQNIVEGAADGVTSMEMEVKLLNCARGSLKELREDYRTNTQRERSRSMSLETEINAAMVELKKMM